jgi:outer membrane lipoprotein SlyB
MGAIAGGIGGGMLGGKANHGFLGTLAGAFAGHKAEEALKKRKSGENQHHQGYGGSSGYGGGKY